VGSWNLPAIRHGMEAGSGKLKVRDLKKQINIPKILKRIGRNLKFSNYDRRKKSGYVVSPHATLGGVSRIGIAICACYRRLALS